MDRESVQEMQRDVGKVTEREERERQGDKDADKERGNLTNS